MITTETKIRVRYADTDTMGVVYHSNYAIFFEVARTEMFRELGIPYSQMEKEGIALPVADLHISYKRSAHYDDLLTVRTTINEKPTVKVVFNYQIFNEQDELLCTGETTLVFLNKATGRPTRIPKGIADLLEARWV